MRKIKLTQGKYALVDNEDYDKLNQYKWFTRKDGQNFYATKKLYILNGVRRNISMHQIIMGIAPKNKEIDHIDGNGLNNQKKNLRFVTHQENMRNQKTRITSKTGFKGIDFNKQQQKYRVRIMLNGKSIFGGYFKNLKDAVKKINQLNY